MRRAPSKQHHSAVNPKRPSGTWFLDSIEDSTAVRFRYDTIRPRGQGTNRLGDVERGLATETRDQRGSVIIIRLLESDAEG